MEEKISGEVLDEVFEKWFQELARRRVQSREPGSARVLLRESLRGRGRMRKPKVLNYPPSTYRPDGIPQLMHCVYVMFGEYPFHLGSKGS